MHTLTAKPETKFHFYWFKQTGFERYYSKPQLFNSKGHANIIT